MKTAFYATYCSVNSGLVLRRWQAANPDACIRLTLVHAYDIENGVNLTKTTYQAAIARSIMVR